MKSDPAPPPDAPVPGVYRHYKGQSYQVLGVARHSETEEWLVVYQALYGSRGFWIRPLQLWLEPVIRDDDTASDPATSTVRFQLIERNGQALPSAAGTVLPK